MLSQIRQDRDTLSLRQVTSHARKIDAWAWRAYTQCYRQVGTAVRFMAEVDHKGEFMPGLAQV